MPVACHFRGDEVDDRYSEYTAAHRLSSGYPWIPCCSAASNIACRNPARTVNPVPPIFKGVSVRQASMFRLAEPGMRAHTPPEWRWLGAEVTRAVHRSHGLHVSLKTLSASDVSSGLDRKQQQIAIRLSSFLFHSSLAVRNAAYSILYKDVDTVTMTGHFTIRLCFWGFCVSAVQYKYRRKRSQRDE